MSRKKYHETQISEYSAKSTVSDGQQTENDRQKPDHPFSKQTNYHYMKQR